MSGRLAGKSALITGGAGSVGSASAQAMAAEGASVMIVDLDAGALADAAKAVEAAAGGDAERVAWQVADVTDEQQVADAVAATVERFGKLDVAFANAGIFGGPAPVTEFPIDRFDRVMKVNVTGSLIVVKHALRVMSDRGSMIINSSVTGLTSFPNITAYATSKHALVGLMRTAAREMAISGRGIRVNSLHPGPIDNEFQHSIEMEETGQSQDEAEEIFNSFIPLARHAAPAEIASAVVYLASDESAFMTGQTVAVDGGITI